MPVLVAVSQATLERGSEARQASRTASLFPQLRMLGLESEISYQKLDHYLKMSAPKFSVRVLESNTNAILSGCPSPTDSEVKRKVLLAGKPFTAAILRGLRG